MLDELIGAIETLKARINEHRAVLQGSEAQTRMSLIDPLLQVLGWDTADPVLVRPEFNLSNGRADYALMDLHEKPAAIIEAKKLNESLGTIERRMQMLTYANFSNVPYAGLTDGSQWVFYRVFDQKPLEERLVLDISIADLPAHQCAMKLLLLWRSNLSSGQPIEASEPIIVTEPPQAPAISPPIQAPIQSVSATPDASWVSLNDFVPEKWGKPPQMRLPNGEHRQPTNWKALLVYVSEWLIQDGALTTDKCPIPMGRKDNCLANLEPRHLNGKDFVSSRRLSNGLFLNCHHGAGDMVKACRNIMQYLGKDPATVHVQVG